MAKQRFKGKVVLVTGASSGIGAATAKAFAREGATVVLAARRRDELQRRAAGIEHAGGRSRVAVVDVRSTDQVRAMVAEVVNEHGRIDVVFNNAGASMVGPIAGDDYIANVREMFEIDYLGQVRVVRAALPIMKQQRSGHIMNMSSVVGHKAFAHFVGYSSVMHAVAGFTGGLRAELEGTGIHVSTIHPALTQTPLLARVDRDDMPPFFRTLSPIPAEEVAAAVLDGIARNRSRVVVPFQPTFLMLAEALSPRLGDLAMRALQVKTIARLLGTYRGSVYQHQPEI